MSEHRSELLKVIHEHSNACYDMAMFNMGAGGNSDKIVERIESSLDHICLILDKQPKHIAELSERSAHFKELASKQTDFVEKLSKLLYPWKYTQ